MLGYRQFTSTHFERGSEFVGHEIIQKWVYGSRQVV